MLLPNKWAKMRRWGSSVAIFSWGHWRWGEFRYSNYSNSYCRWNRGTFGKSRTFLKELPVILSQAGWSGLPSQFTEELRRCLAVQRTWTVELYTIVDMTSCCCLPAFPKVFKALQWAGWRSLFLLLTMPPHPRLELNIKVWRAHRPCSTHMQASRGSTDTLLKSFFPLGALRRSGFCWEMLWWDRCLS